MGGYESISQQDQQPEPKQKFTLGDREEFYKAIVGDEDQEYYLKCFSRFYSNQGFCWSWNWTAFFSTFLWCVYRKLWVEAILYLLIGFVLLSIFGALNINFGLWLLCMFLFPATYANYSYYIGCTKIIEKLENENLGRQDKLNKLSRVGGVFKYVIPIFLLRKYPLTLLFCSIVFFAFAPWSGLWLILLVFLTTTPFLALFLLLVTIIWFEVRIRQVSKGKASGTELRFQTLLITFTCAIVIPFAHYSAKLEERKQMENLSNTFESYRQQNGLFPKELSQAGIIKNDRVDYTYFDWRSPRLTYMVYSGWEGGLFVYDVINHQWDNKGYNFASGSESQFWEGERYITYDGKMPSS
ncbi:DUF2628 domain-containing protein [Methylomonas rosea]|uniref:DUF2628 domain-containing protein n=1 Tax=Methylomonas rosea TaxID=2952227 RepID=A0ABT1TYZ8_9GAMM|nr:DUF2628 domain-containing protein [Methylomonas sp. WSC-7]MCQ8119997.1 DUF2628 domain-containing protein [Methylomonas sp. WSC-7]